MSGRLRRWLWRVLRGVVTLLLLSWLPVLLFAFVPVPGSAVMLGYAWERHTAQPQRPALRHQWVAADAMPDHLRLAAIAAEDQRFTLHHGFDVEAIRSALRERRDGGRLRGASTISQQTAKNLFLWNGRSWLRKGLEVWFTLLIELTWSKQRILTVYLNIAEFDLGVYGVGAAAAHHFGKPVGALSADEAALLAAALPSPRRYDAGAPSAYVRERAAWIRRQMRQLGPDALP